MEENEIDNLIILACNYNWQKCAMVIAKSVDFAEDKISPSECAASIGRLIKQKIIVSQGEISDWRESEIRLSI